MKDIQKMLANRIAFYRKKRGISQEELGFRTKLHRTYIGMIENCKRSASLANIQKIAEALNIDYKELFYIDK